MKLTAEWFWVDRWMGSSAFLLPMEARGLYREMLSQAWRRGAQLPNDPAAIQRAVAAQPWEWERTWPLVRGYWQERNGILVNETQVEIFRDSQDKLIRASEHGRKGALGRFGRR